jgi:hypothetical protein
MINNNLRAPGRRKSSPLPISSPRSFVPRACALNGSGMEGRRQRELEAVAGERRTGSQQSVFRQRAGRKSALRLSVCVSVC